MQDQRVSDAAGRCVPFMPGAQPRAFARHKQSTGLFVSGRTPSAGLAPGLLLCFTPHSNPPRRSCHHRGNSGRNQSQIGCTSHVAADVGDLDATDGRSSLMDYHAIKALHMSAVALSFTGFFARGIGSLNGAAWVQHRTAKTLPHVIDSVLISSALVLA